jgi:hypothetical protein
MQVKTGTIDQIIDCCFALEFTNSVTAQQTPDFKPTQRYFSLAQSIRPKLRSAWPAANQGENKAIYVR